MDNLESLIIIALKRVDELAQEAFAAHKKYVVWRPETPESEREKLCSAVECQEKLEEQHKWVIAISKVFQTKPEA